MSAHNTSKSQGLSDVEKLMFVMVKRERVVGVHHADHPHKLMFMLFADRSENWWRTKHAKVLGAIAKEPVRYW